MIEQLLANRETIPYALAISAIILAVTIGYKLGAKDPTSVCSEYIVDLERYQKQAHDLNDELTRCKAKRAGGRVLDCVAICDKRVSKALDNYKEVVCSD